MGKCANPSDSCVSTFLDAYARYRNQLVSSNQHQGHTLSINLPLWSEKQVDRGGIRMLPSSERIATTTLDAGIQSIFFGLRFGHYQMIVVESEHVSVGQEKEWNLPSSDEQEFEMNDKNSNLGKALPTCPSGLKIETDTLQKNLQTTFLQMVAQLLKVRTEDIDIDAELGEYGVDSIMLTALANKLNQRFKLDLTPPIFFEHPSISSFVNYMIEKHESVFAAELTVQSKTESSIKPVNPMRFRMAPSNHKRFPLRLTQVTSESEHQVREPIAIVGMSGRFPMAKNLDEFWRNLVEGKDCIREIPKDRWDWKALYGDPQKEKNKSNIKWGGFIEGIGSFDPLFFGISPREAELMDPQQRLLMTYVWKAIEDAGYSAQCLAGTQTAIFVGTARSGYLGHLSDSNPAIEGYTSTGTVSSMGPNRMSFFLNVHGPSEPIETACSSSLIALHRGVQCIENGSCDMAIVGGGEYANNTRFSY